MVTVRRFGTFEGVFTPTILTILGAIMYLRLGWVVGNAGFGGALLIIFLAKLVTITTGLAMASMTSNIKIGAGGSYAIISRSMGLEVGGAVGIPLYISQSLGAAMYIVGFTEAWVAIYPDHNPLIIASIVLLSLLTISFISAKVAMKVQYIIMALIATSLISFFMGDKIGTGNMVVWGNFEKASFWTVFAIFFPAVTGIEAGAAMSGDLKDPKKSLSVGILSAIAVSFIIYIALAFWLDHLADPHVLQNNYTIMMDLAKWRGIVGIAIFGATLSSAMGSLVGGPRTLMALGQHKVIPWGKFFGQQSKNGEPRIAILVTGFIVLIYLILGDLNSIAPLLTMFFLITYGIINLVVFIEKKIGIASYRPSFDIPLFIPLIGVLWCTIAMFLINPIFAGVAIIVIMIIYGIQIRKGHHAPWGDVRAGIFTAIAEWAIRMAALMPKSAKTWKPNIMVPVENPLYWQKRMSFIRDIVFPKGSVRVFSVNILHHTVRERINSLVDQFFHQKESEPPIPLPDKLERELELLINPLQKEGILAVSTVIEANHFLEGISIITQSFRGMPLPPNTMFLSMSQDPHKTDRLKGLISIAVREEMGIIILRRHKEKGFGNEKLINLWIRSGSPNRNLTILTALQLERNWDGKIRLIRVVKNPSEVKKATIGLHQIFYRGRFPVDTEQHVFVGDFDEELQKCPPADINIFGMPVTLNIHSIFRIAMECDSACLFIRDSGEESVLV